MPSPLRFVYGGLGVQAQSREGEEGREGRRGEEREGGSVSSSSSSSLGQPLSCLLLLIQGRLFISMHDGQAQRGHVWVAQGTQGGRGGWLWLRRGWWFLECVGRGHEQPGSLKVVRKTLS